MIRASACALVMALLVAPAACGGGTTEPAWVSARASGCGLTILSEPACEAAVDDACCAQQQQCVSDAACKAVADCYLYCRGRGDACMSNCTPQGGATPGYVLFEHMAKCTKFVKYPDGFACDK